jgi:DNA-binding response OmpR family regulator
MRDVLIASSNTAIAADLEYGLRANHFMVQRADSAELVMRHLTGDLTGDEPLVTIISDEIDCQPGFRVSTWFKNNGGRSPIVIIGEPNAESIATALDAGADDFVTERTDFREVLCRIRALLRRFPLDS